MKTEIICAIVAAGGTLLSALIAFFVSRTTANKELEKMKLTWAREDLVSSDDEFAEMAEAVSKYVQNNYGKVQSDAMSKIAAVRSKEINSIAVILDDLYKYVRMDNPNAADEYLTKAINEKRKIKSDAKTSKGNKPKK